MKKKILFILILAVLFSACKMKLSENIGTVVIDFGGNERAIGPNGLPIIKDASMSLEITSSSQGTQKIDLAAGKEKKWSGSFPVGEKLSIKVSLNTASAKWKGSAEHTVTEGTNRVSIKLKKTAAGLNNLLFGTDKLYSSGPHDYTLKLNIGSEEIEFPHIRYHNFCRDNKGRTYFAYNTGNAWKIERYTSEGEKEDKAFTLPTGCHRLMLSSDHATGKVYLVAEINWPMKLYRINEDGTHTELAGSSIRISTGYAVYNDILISADQHQLNMYRINGDDLSEIPLSVPPNLSEDTKIMLGTNAAQNVEIRDLYMTSDALYVLFSTFDNNVSGNGSYYSLGGIVKYSYTADDTTGAVNHPTRIGIKNEHSEQNGIFETGEDNFYGPIKVVGFDEKNIYIADDGVKFEYKNGQVHPTANKNRIAALNRENDTLKFSDAPIGISWMGEEAIWEGTKTKTLVWNKNRAGHGFDYYQLNSVTDSLPSDAEPFEPGEGDVSPYNYLTDVFCFDEDGNLYIVKYKKDGGGQDKYQICRFELENDGSYSKLPEIAELDFDSHILPEVFAIAAGKSGTKNVLYYSYSVHTFYVKRLEWSGARFESASVSSEWKIESTNGGDVQTLFTSLAANQDSLFVGEVAYFDSTTQYNISVKKYPHDNPDYNNPQGIVDVAVGSLGNNDTIIILEILNALCIQDGVLYGLTSKTKIEKDAEDRYILFAQSGRLFKVGNTSSFPSNGNASKLYGDDDVDDDSDGSFAPYRFIALKSKKLVITSDGGYGARDSNFADNKNRIWTFSLNDSGDLAGSPQSENKGSSITFSKELKWNSDKGTFLLE